MFFARMKKRKVKKILFAFVPLFLLLAGGELAARWVITHSIPSGLKPLWAQVSVRNEGRIKLILNGSWKHRDSEFDQYNGYRLRPSKDPASRRPPRMPLPPKSAGEVRILCMGDSVTFGSALSEKEAWPARLQAHLEAWQPSGIHFEVYNGGVPAYGPQQCKRLFQSQYIGMESDILIWHERPEIDDRLELSGKPMSQGWLAFQDFAFRSRLLFVLANFHHRGSPWVKTRSDQLNLKPGDVVGRPASFGQFVRWCENRGVAGVLGIEYLHLVEGASGELHLEGNAKDWLEQGLDYVPLREAFEAGGEADLASRFIDAFHFSPKGADLCARSIGEQLRLRWPALEKAIFSKRPAPPIPTGTQADD